MPARSLMFQGTGSDVGKSLIVAGLCRALARQGYRVRPFKPQNMSNNAAVTVDGGEIGRAQALQARASKIDPTVDMNPVLLKPESDQNCQVIVQGKVFKRCSAHAYQSLKKTLLPRVLESFERLKSDADIILVEGAGSAAEINLRDDDIANMGFAEAAHVPVILIGDIDRGGVIASIVGTHTILPEPDRRWIRGYLINKFRGDLALFEEGLLHITALTAWPSFGVIPFLSEARKLPAEDSLIFDQSRNVSTHIIKIAIPLFSRIANFDDFDPLKCESAVTVMMIPPGQPLPGDADLIILPGTKSTLEDLQFLRQNGWDIDLYAHIRRGGRVLGICGGYQMLGKMIHDPLGVDGPSRSEAGLGLLDVTTVMSEEKTLRHVVGKCLTTGILVKGFEMHVGETTGPDTSLPMLQLGEEHFDGARSENRLVEGCYVHGLFTEDAFRRAYLGRIKALHGPQSFYAQEVETILDKLANHLEAHLDLEALLRCAL